MLHKTKIKTLLYASIFGLCLPGCTATLDGLKQDIGTISQKTGLGNTDTSSGLVEGPTEPEENLVSQIQTLLKGQGYYGGEVDGEFSAQTEAAIQDFQLDNDLRIDGRPSSDLLEVLRAI